MELDFLYFIYILLIYPFLNKFIRKKEILLLFAIIPLFIVLGFQVGIGEDYYSYIKIFHGEKIFSYSRGPLFKLIINYLKIIFNKERSMFIVIALIQSFLYYQIVYKLYKNKLIENISIFILLTIVCTYFYLMMFNGLRSSLGALFIVLSVLFLLENKFIKNFATILLGSLFHPSVIIWIGIFCLKKYLYRKKSIFFFVTYFLSNYILNKLQVIRKTAKIIYDLQIDIPYRWYLVSEHMFPYVKKYGIAITINMFLFLFSLYFYNKEKNKRKIFLYNIGYLFFGLRLLFANIPIFSRLLTPSELFQTYVIYKLIEKTLNKKWLYTGALVILFYILSFIIGRAFY